MKTTLNANNVVYADAMKAALSAVFHLDDMGCCVLKISIKSRNPVVRIAPPPKSCATLVGAVRMWKKVGNTIQSVMSAPFHGTQVEWIASSQHAPGTWAGSHAHA